VSADIIGCTDTFACNYNPNSNIEDNSCEYALEYFDCEGNCLFDSDGDGVCDELEMQVSHIEPGSYFYTMRAGDFEKTKQLVILK
jgi:hypothetical protein